MVNLWSRRMLYNVGAFASVLGLIWTVLAIGLPPWTSTRVDLPGQSVSPTQFKRSGDLSKDVQEALIMKGYLEGEPGNSRSQHIKEAIKRAENSRGLPTDGVPDLELLRQLEAELGERQSANDMSISEQSRGGGMVSGWTIGDWERIAQIVFGLNAMFMGWLGLFRRGGKRPEATV